MTDRTRRALHRGGGTEGDCVILSREESLHLCRVLRLGAGATLSVFDGEGREWDAVLERPEPVGAHVRLGEERTDPVEPPLPVTVVQGLCRPERMEWLFQKGTEVGVARFVMFRGSRSGSPAPSVARRERWERILAESCKQCGRRRIPALKGPVPEPPFPAPGETGLLLVPGARPVGTVLLDRPPAGVLLGVGPEGGFSEDERREWRDRGWTEVSLGPRVLRTETAGVVAAALVLHAWGDMGRG